MACDPLWIIKQEIANRQESYKQKTCLLSEKAEKLKAQIAEIRSQKDAELQQLQNTHNSICSTLRETHSHNVSTLKSEYQEKKEKIDNHAFAENLIIDTQFEEESLLITQEIQQIEETEAANQSETMSQAESSLLSMRSVIEESSRKYRELALKMDEFTDKKLIENRVDKYRRGPRVTPFDKEMREIETSVADAHLEMEIRIGKMNEQFQKLSQLNKFTLRKIKRDVTAMTSRADAAKAHIKENNADHEAKMRALRMEIIKLTNSPAPKMPNAKKVKTMKQQIVILSQQMEDMQAEVETLNATYQSEAAKNRKLKQRLKTRQFSAGQPAMAKSRENLSTAVNSRMASPKVREY